MKPITWAVLAAAVIVAIAVLAGQGDIRRFRRMRGM
jgi:hypothetical protein